MNIKSREEINEGEFIKKQGNCKFKNSKTLQLHSEKFKTWKQEDDTMPIGPKSKKQQCELTSWDRF